MHPFAILKILSVVGPILYGGYLYFDYQAMTRTISGLHHEVTALKKSVVTWEGRYERINIKREDYKQALLDFNAALEAAGCTERVDKAIKKIKSDRLHKETFGNQNRGG